MSVVWAIHRKVTTPRVWRDGHLAAAGARLSAQTRTRSVEIRRKKRRSENIFYCLCDKELRAIRPAPARTKTAFVRSNTVLGPSIAEHVGQLPARSPFRLA